MNCYSAKKLYAGNRTIIRALLFTTLALAGFLFLPSSVQAHDDTTVEAFGSFIGGLLHPVLGLDHLLAMLSVGILSAQIGGRSIWLVPATFVVVMAPGFLIGLTSVDFGYVEIGIALSVLVLGLVIAAARHSVPILLVMAAVGFFAMFHGYAHGSEMPEIAQPVRYALGFMFGTATIHITGVLIGDIPGHYKYGPWVLRALGLVITVFGGIFLANAI